jgi:hypothetical protein
MSDPTDSLHNDPGTLKSMLLAERARAERLRRIIKKMQRHRTLDRIAMTRCRKIGGAVLVGAAQNDAEAPVRQEPHQALLGGRLEAYRGAGHEGVTDGNAVKGISYPERYPLPYLSP